jgi:hypothetical protein
MAKTRDEIINEYAGCLFPDMLLTEKMREAAASTHEYAYYELRVRVRELKEEVISASSKWIRRLLG